MTTDTDRIEALTAEVASLTAERARRPVPPCLVPKGLVVTQRASEFADAPLERDR